MHMHHYLKIEPKYFRAILNGDKNFEIRENDRDFQKGDIVTLKEYEYKYNEPEEKSYSGNEINVKIKYVTTFNQVENWVVFGFDIVESLPVKEGWVCLKLSK